MQKIEDFLNQSHYQELYEIYTSDEWAKDNITKTTRKWCEKNNIGYNDNIRRKASTILSKGFSDELVTQESFSDQHQAKILIYDLETSFIEYRGFSLYPNFISHKNITKDWNILSFSAKWLFKDEIISFGLTPEEALAGDDSRIVKELWKLFDEADITVAHNLVKFDNRKSNARFLKHNLFLPSHYKMIDTLQHARRIFALTSNRLDYIATFLGIPGKLENSEGLWHKVMEGDAEAMKQMIEYNEQDVRLLEEVYLKLRPYMRNHVNINLFVADDVSVCPTCGGHDLDWDLKTKYITNVNKYTTFRCNTCKSLGRSRTPLKLSTKNLTVPIAGN